MRTLLLFTAWLILVLYALVGWPFYWQVSAPRPGDAQAGDTWSRGSLTYVDQNGDGIPDLKRLHSGSTNKLWWEDTDFDGVFDQQVEQGCYDGALRVTPISVAAPQSLSELYFDLAQWWESR